MVDREFVLEVCRDGFVELLKSDLYRRAARAGSKEGASAEMAVANVLGKCFHIVPRIGLPHPRDVRAKTAFMAIRERTQPH
jgi:hypothetical protein